MMMSHIRMSSEKIFESDQEFLYALDLPLKKNKEWYNFIVFKEEDKHRIRRFCVVREVENIYTQKKCFRFVVSYESAQEAIKKALQLAMDYNIACFSDRGHR